jgi:signal transduction histidine kinase/HAMP domain-containing protein
VIGLDLGRWRLARRVAAAAAALTLAFVILIGGAAYVVLRSLVRTEVEYSVNTEASLRAQKVGDVLDNMVAGAASLAANTVVANALADSIGRETYVAPLLADFAEVGGVPVRASITDYRGQVILGPWPEMDGATAWVGGLLAAGQGGARVEDGAGDPVLAIVQPVSYVNTGSVEGALVYRVRLADLARRASLKSASGFEGELVFADGDRLRKVPLEGSSTRAPESSAMEDEPGPAAEVAVPAPPVLAPFRFSVRVAVEEGVLDKPLARLTFFFLGVGVVAVLAVLGISLLLGKRLTQRLTRLAEAASSFSLEHSDRSAFQLAGEDEIARLGQAFAGMVERLDKAFQDLERRSQTLLSNAERVAHVGSAVWDLRTGRHTWSDEFLAILSGGEVVLEPSLTALLNRIDPVDRDHIRDVIQAALGSGARVAEEFRVPDFTGLPRVLNIQAEVAADDNGQPIRLDATLQDITERKRMEERLDGLIAELRRSNEELEQFAYVASHDLRQPLRAVGSYVSLIEAELAGALNDETREYMGFARSGVKRMDALITDLLSYSRVGRTGQDEPVAMDEAVAQALADLQPEIDLAGAQVRVPASLPVVLAEFGEMARLFQNLVGNAVKYRSSERTPEVVLSVTDAGGFWQVSVADNGIGIPPEHAERIFGIFQRLHARDEYEGTGVGLAICKKIVERRGGRIWVEGAPGQGTVFRFTWPKAALAGRPDLRDAVNPMRVESGA